MGSIKALTLAAVVVLGAIAPAFAADLLPPPPMVEPPVVAPDISGWYLRGDVGVGINEIGGFRSTLQPTNLTGGAAPAIFNAYNDLGDSALIGAGVGYQINNWFRADVTGEYRSSAPYRSGMGYTAFCGGAYCLDTYSSNIASAVFLANGYVDLGTWYGVTPYIGAGVGLAHNHMGAMTDVGVGTGYAADRSSDNFAWAAMAGLAFSVTPNLKLDLGYRYLDMGSVRSNPIVCGYVTSCYFETQSYHQAAHDFRIGFRYILGDYGMGPVVAANAPIFGGAPGPLVRKY